MGVMTTTSINPGGLARLRALGLSEKTWFNAIWFQSTWFLCVLGRDTWLPAALAMVALHLLLVPALGRELRTLLPLVAVGVGVDAALSALGVFDFKGVLLPLWLVVLWFAFATTITRAFAVFAKRPALAALIGGVGVPFNYGVGAKLGAVVLPLEPWLTAGVLVVVWAVLFPLLFRLAALLNPSGTQPS